MTSWNVAVGDEVELNQTLCSWRRLRQKSRSRARTPAGSPNSAARWATCCRWERCWCASTREPPPAQRNPMARHETPFSSDMAPTRRPTAAVGRGEERARLEESRNQAPRDDDAGRGTSPAEESRNQAQRPRARPAVRKLAAELLVDLATLQPGPDGVISREAVLAAAGVQGEQRSGVTHDVLPVRGVHAEMAKRMTLSRSQIPDAHASVDVDGSRLLELRDSLGLTPFALTLRLLVLALTHHRIFNSTWVEGPDGPQVHTHHAVHLGVAAAAPRGLLVPVIRDAQAKTTRELSEGAHASHRRGAERHRPARRVGRVDVHGVQLRGARSGRGCPGDQPPGGRDPRSGIAAAPAGRRRRCRGDPVHDEADLRLRPPGRRRRPGGGIPRRASCTDRSARDRAARSVGVTARRRSAGFASNATRRAGWSRGHRSSRSAVRRGSARRAVVG